MRACVFGYEHALLSLSLSLMCVCGEKGCFLERGIEEGEGKEDAETEVESV